MSAAILYLLAASPLVAANAIRRQASLDDFATGLVNDLTAATDIASLSDFALPTGTDLPSGIETDFPTSTLLGGDLGDLKKCAFPSTITLPAGVPTLGAAGAEYAATVTDACELFGSSVPTAVAADVSSYTSALSRWASQNAQAISSYEQAANSFINAVKTDPACSSLYSTAASIATDGQAACSQVNTAKSIASSAAASGNGGAGVTSASGKFTASTAVVGTSGAPSAAGATTSRAGNAAGATVAPHNSVLLAGGAIAITSLLGMILL